MKNVSRIFRLLLNLFIGSVGLIILLAGGNWVYETGCVTLMSNEEIEVAATLEAAKDLSRHAGSVRVFSNLKEGANLRDCNAVNEAKFEGLLETLIDMKADRDTNPIRLKRIQTGLAKASLAVERNADYVGYELSPRARRGLDFHRQLRIARNVITRDFKKNRQLFDREAADDESAAAEEAEAQRRLAGIEEAFADPTLDDEGYKARLKELLPTEWENAWALTAAKRMNYHLQREAGGSR